jgi:hypothetical protein
MRGGVGGFGSGENGLRISEVGVWCGLGSELEMQ